MKRKLIDQMLYPILIGILVLITLPARSQEQSEGTRSKNVFVEFLGSGATIITANFDMRFHKGRNDGLGMRLGLGGGSVNNDYLIGEGSVKTKLFTVPLEVNYILGKRRFAWEVGCAITYVSISEDSTLDILDYHSENFETGNVIVSYIPIGFRFKPDKNGFMLKLNVGPLWNFSAPNLFAEEEMVFWGGLAIGYSFY